MTAPKHPTDFYIAHRVFSGAPFKAPIWGSMTDGPEDRDDVVARILDDMIRRDCSEPSLATVKVWHFQDDVPPRDVTEDVLAIVAARQAEAFEVAA